jgi:hypothetical protein
MSTLYLKGIEQAFLGNIDCENDTIKLKYMATSYTPNAGTDAFLSDVSASEASGAPTETLANVDIRIDAANSRVEFDADDVTENSITTATDKFIVYKDTGVEATSPLIACVDIVEGTLAPVAGTISVTFNTEGIFAINAA